MKMNDIEWMWSRLSGDIHLINLDKVHWEVCIFPDPYWLSPTNDSPFLPINTKLHDAVKNKQTEQQKQQQQQTL